MYLFNIQLCFAKKKKLYILIYILELLPLTTLKEETFAGRNFRGSEKPQNIYISRE